MHFKSILLVMLYCLLCGMMGTFFIAMLSVIIVCLKKLALKLIS